MQESRRIACPDCSHTRRKKNSKDCVVTVKPDGAEVYFCHHCNSSGVLGGVVKEEKKCLNHKLFQKI